MGATKQCRRNLRVRSSLNTTACCIPTRSQQGLEAKITYDLAEIAGNNVRAKLTLGICSLMLLVNSIGMGGLGSTLISKGSIGPGTITMRLYPKKVRTSLIVEYGSLTSASRSTDNVVVNGSAFQSALCTFQHPTRVSTIWYMHCVAHTCLPQNYCPME